MNGMNDTFGIGLIKGFINNVSYYFVKDGKDHITTDTIAVNDYGYDGKRLLLTSQLY